MRVPSLVMFAIAALALAIAAYLAVRSALFVIGAERVAGEVVRIETNSFEIGRAHV